jgi:hypothetical protein
MAETLFPVEFQNPVTAAPCAPVGWVVTPRMCTRRVVCSMTKKTSSWAAGSDRPGTRRAHNHAAAGRRCAGCETGQGFIVTVRLDGPGQRFFSQDSRLECPSEWGQCISGTEHPSRLAGRQSTRPRPWGRQHCLYLRPEPHQHGPVRGGGQLSMVSFVCRSG